jgi:hypothetical protein
VTIVPLVPLEPLEPLEPAVPPLEIGTPARVPPRCR